MAEDFEDESSESFGKELAKSITMSAAGAVAMVVGLYGGTIAVEKISEWRKNRKSAKTEPETVWESE